MQVEDQPGVYSQLGGYTVRASLTKGVWGFLKGKRTMLYGHIDKEAVGLERENRHMTLTSIIKI